MPARVHYDGDYSFPTQHGAAIVEDLLLEKSKLYRVTYHQSLDAFEARKPTYADRGEVGTLWQGLPLVEWTPTTDIGGGIGQWTATYAEVPPVRTDFALFSFEYQRVTLATGAIDSMSVTVRSTLQLRYQYTTNPDALPAGEVFRALKVGSDIVFIGTEPAPGASSFLGEDTAATRWMGNIWMTTARYVPAKPFGTLPRP